MFLRLECSCDSIVPLKSIYSIAHHFCKICDRLELMTKDINNPKSIPFLYPILFIGSPEIDEMTK